LRFDAAKRRIGLKTALKYPKNADSRLAGLDKSEFFMIFLLDEAKKTLYHKVLSNI
jgi:hypothetical protein